HSHTLPTISLHSPAQHSDLPSLPTRRSSDLGNVLWWGPLFSHHGRCGPRWTSRSGPLAIPARIGGDAVAPPPGRIADQERLLRYRACSLACSLRAGGVSSGVFLSLALRV